MNVNLKRSTAFITLLGALMVAVCGAWAMQGALKPTVVATVDLSAVLEGLNQRGEADAALKKMRDDMLAKGEAMQAELKAMEEELTGLADDAPQRTPLRQKFDAAKVKFVGWRDFANEKLDIEQALRLQDLYRSVKTEVENLCKQAGYDVVLVDDSKGELSMNPSASVQRVDQVQNQIASRQLLYANKAIDITDELIARMNNAHKAAGVKPAG